jgi:hypothetical protein
VRIVGFLGAATLVTASCSTDTTTGDDASTDGTAEDVVMGVDASKGDAPSDVSVDSLASDATNDVTVDDASDASQGTDADDGGSSDSGAFDAGKKGCLGVFCIVGRTCCNVMSSPNYGLCEPSSCSSCCM